MKKAIVVIPTYNEAQVIRETIVKVFAATEHIQDTRIEILVFDSASTDDTQAIVQQLIPVYEGQLYLQTEPYKTGLGSAYMQAMRYALRQLKADVVIEFDADLSHQPQYLIPILTLLETCDVVVGSRYIAGGKLPANWAMYRKLLSRIGNQVARLFLTRKYHDFTSGFRATKREVLLHSLPDQFISNHYAYKLQLLWLLHCQQAHIREFPIHFVDRQFGYSKLPANSIKDALNVIMRLRYSQFQMSFKAFRRFGNNKA